MKHDASLALIKFLSDLAKSLGVSRHVYVVGGAIRNFVMDPTGRGYPVKDIDVVVDSVALGKDSEWFAQQVARNIPTQTKITPNQYGVALLHIVGDWMLGGANLKGEDIEIANARKESYTDGGYKPGEVEPATIRDDVVRREFTFNCMAGDTLIPTEKGILRIDQIASREDGEQHAIHLTVAGQDGPATAVGWQYSGFAPTLRVTTEWGHSFSCTHHHPVLVLRGHSHEWVQADQLEEGDLLCVPVRQVTRRTPLILDLPDPVQPKRGLFKEVRKPDVMTPDLAFLIGCIVAEGSNTHKRVSFSNSDPALISRYVECFHATFGFQPSRNKVVEKGSVRILGGVKFVASADGYDIYANSKTVVGWLEDLGLYCGGSKNGKSASHHKVVPWSILQADERSQWAFLAAYLEGDGSIRPETGRITYCSASPHVRQQLQVLLGAHGILSKVKDRFVYINAVDSVLLCEKIWPWMVTKRFDYTQRNTKARNRYGIPADYIRGFLAGRKQDTGQRPVYATDGDGFRILPDVHEPVRKVQRLLHDAHARGDFDGFMAGLKVISPDEHIKLQRLFDLGYQYVEVMSVEDAGEQDVFDISMGEGVEPAFVANGVVVHNTLMWRLHDLAEGPDQAEILDLTGCGLRDLQEGVMRCPSSPDKTFTDDPSRMIRAIKFLIKYGFKLSLEVERSILKNKDKLKNIPHAHLSNMLINTFLREPTGKKALLEMKRLGLLDVIREIALTTKPFREALANWADKEARVEFLFDLMDLELPAGRRLLFLTPEQRGQVREVVVQMDHQEAEKYLQVLTQPGKMLDTQALMTEFNLQGAAARMIQDVARQVLIRWPELLGNPAVFMAKVRQGLQPQVRLGKTFELNVGDPVLHGKFLNKPGVIKDFGKNDKGDPTVVIEPPSGGQGKEVKLFKVRYDEKRSPKEAALDRLVQRWVDGGRRKLANPTLLRDYPLKLQALKDKVAYNKARLLGNTAELWVRWYEFYRVGKEWAGYVIDHLALPAKAAKPVEMAVRLFSKSYGIGKGPPDIIKWFEANEARLDLLDQARSWPERSEESGVFTVGPFTVHDTIQASPKDLANATAIVERAAKEARSSGVPGFAQMAYGQLYLVGQLARKNWAAWYVPQKDSIYLRPGVRGSSVEESARHLIHELGHRYWSKKLDQTVKSAWLRHHSGMFRNKPDRRVPEVGEVLVPVVNGKKVKVDSYEPGKAVLVDVVTGELVGKVDRLKLTEWVQDAAHKMSYPTLYAATDAEEHFCESLSLYAQGRLKGDNLAAFEQIVLGVNPAAVARIAVRVAGAAKPGSQGQKMVPQGRFEVWYLPKYETGLDVVLRGLAAAERLYDHAQYRLPDKIPVVMSARAWGSQRSIYTTADGGFIQLVPAAFADKGNFATFVHELAHYFHSHAVRGGFTNGAIRGRFQEVSAEKVVESRGSAVDKAQDALKEIEKEFSQVAKSVRPGMTLDLMLFKGFGFNAPKALRPVRVLEKKGRGDRVQIVVEYLDRTPEEVTNGIRGDTLGLRYFVLAANDPSLKALLADIMARQSRAIEVYNNAVTSEANGDGSARYENPRSLWFPTDYSKTNSMEWFAELVTARLLAPSKMDPEVQAWLDQVAKTGSARQAAKYQDKKTVKTKDGDEAVVYEYSERQVQNRNREKAERVEKLRGNLHKLQSQVAKDLKSKDDHTRLCALAVGLMNDTYERVGNEESAKDGHVGVTGWTPEHVKFGDGKATFSYVGKSGVKQEKVTKDADLIRVLKEAVKDKKKGDTLFTYEGGKVDAAAVNEYLDKLDLGITAKDIRGLHANREMQERLKDVRSKGGKLPEDKKEREKKLKDEFKEALGGAAEAVGHEPSTLKSQYLVPGLEDAYLKDGTVLDKLHEKKGTGRVAIIHLNNATDGNDPSDWEMRGFGGLTSSLTQYETAIVQDLSIHETAIEHRGDHYILRGHLVDPDAVIELVASGYLTEEGNRISLSPLFRAKVRLYSQEDRVTRRVAARYLASGHLQATKTPAQKEDKDVRQMLKPDPKKKPPREDLRRNRMRTEDTDLSDEGGDDLSLNYKKVAQAVAERWVRSLMAADPPPPPKPKDPERQPGKVWKSEEGDGWVGMNKAEATHTFEKKEQAEAFAQGKSPEEAKGGKSKGDEPEKDKSKGDEPEKDKPKKPSADTLKRRKDVDKALTGVLDKLPKAQAASLREQFGEVEDDPDKAAAEEKVKAAEKALAAAKKKIQPQVDELEQQIAARQGVDNAAAAKLVDQLDALRQPIRPLQEAVDAAETELEKIQEATTAKKTSFINAVADALKDAEAAEREALEGKPITKAMMERASGNPFKKVKMSDPVAVAQALARQRVQEEVLLNPAKLGGKALSAEPLEPKALTARSVAALEQYQHGKAELRKQAAQRAVDELASLDPKSPQAQELNRIIDGIHAAMEVNGEKWDITGEDGKLIREPLDAKQGLLFKQMLHRGKAHLLLGDPSDFKAQRDGVRDALGHLDDAQLQELAKDTPLAPIADLLGPLSTLAPDVQDLLRDLLRDSNLNNMTVNRGLINAVAGKKMPASNPLEAIAEVEKELSRPEPRKEVKSIIDCLIEARGDPKATEKCIEGKSSEDWKEAVEGYKKSNFARLNAQLDEMAKDGGVDEADPRVARIRHVGETGDLSILDVPLEPAKTPAEEKADWLKTVRDPEERKRIQEMSPDEFNAMVAAILDEDDLEDMAKQGAARKFR